MDRLVCPEHVLESPGGSTKLIAGSNPRVPDSLGSGDEA